MATGNLPALRKGRLYTASMFRLLRVESTGRRFMNLVLSVCACRPAQAQIKKTIRYLKLDIDGFMIAGDGKCFQVGFRRRVLHEALLRKFAAVAGAYQEIAVRLELAALVGALHQYCRIRLLAKAVYADGEAQLLSSYEHV